MRCSPRFVPAVAILVLPATPLHSQTTDLAARIQRIENGLLPAVVIAGTDPHMQLRERLARLNVPGISIAVVNDGRIEWARGYGVTEAGRDTPVDTATLFQAASISKPVSAMAVLRLVDQGRLDLDADVNTYLKSWQVPLNGFTQAAPVTLRQLLSHSAGLTVHGFRGYAQGEPVPGIRQVLDGVPPANSAAVRADTLPGALWRYSGGGSSVVQLLLEDVTGSPFPRLLRELVLEPVGMVHSGFEQPLPAGRAAAAATGHHTNGQPVAGRWHTYPEMFAAGLWTTPSDLARLVLDVQASMNGGRGVLSSAMARRMLTTQAGSYGLGFGLEHGDDWTAFSHGGSNVGFRAFFVGFAERGQGAAIMTNGDAGASLAAEVIRAIAQEYDWPAHQAITREIVALDSARRSEFVGSYDFMANGAQQTVTVTPTPAGLRASGRVFPAPRDMHYAGDDTFFFVESTAELRFARDPGGRVVALMLAGSPPVRAVRR